MHVCQSENANLRCTYGQNTLLGPDLPLGSVTQCYVFYPVCGMYIRGSQYYSFLNEHTHSGTLSLSAVIKPSSFPKLISATVPNKRWKSAADIVQSDLLSRPEVLKSA